MPRPKKDVQPILSKADIYFIENNRNLSAEDLSKSIDKPIKLITDYVQTLPKDEINDFKVEHNQKIRATEKTMTHQGMTKTENTTVATERASEAMTNCQVGVSTKLKDAIHRIRE